MAIQSMTTQDARVGILRGEILKHAIPVEVLGITGTQKEMPKNEGKVVSFRRWLPRGGVDNIWITNANHASFAGDHETTEGTTPTAETLAAVDIEVTLKEYAVLFSLTNQVVDLYEDSIDAPMKVQTGQRLGLVREMVRYGVLRGGTNVYYAGGTSRATVDKTITLGLLRNVAKGLLRNHAARITKVLSSSGNYGTKPVEPGFLVFCSTDMEPAIRDLPGFTKVADYGQRQTVNENEIGSCERFRFVLSPELAGYANAGAAVGSTDLVSSAGSNIDVYPVIVVGEDAWGQVMLRGSNALNVVYLPPGQPDKADPLGQKGYIGARAYHAAVILNQGRMALIEAGTPDLTGE